MSDSFARSTRGARDARDWGLIRRAWFKASGFDDVERLSLLVDDTELSRRRAAWTPPPAYRRGYGRLFVDHVLQANAGCDFDFLRPA